MRLTFDVTPSKRVAIIDAKASFRSRRDAGVILVEVHAAQALVTHLSLLSLATDSPSLRMHTHVTSPGCSRQPASPHDVFPPVMEKDPECRNLSVISKS